MRILLAVLLFVAPLWGYTYKATVTFSGASGSTQSNITLAFSFSDIKLAYKTTTGGQIQNLCSRNGGTNNVPCDFVFTDDSTCATITGGYTWGFDGDYSSTAGTGHGWLMIPSYTTSSKTPVVCIGDASVSAYLGGAAGAEFDSNTVLAIHAPDGTTPSAVDFSASGNNGTINSVSATSGQIDGGFSFSGSTTNKVTGFTQVLPGGTTAFTLEGWIYPTRYGANSAGNAIWYQGTGSSSATLALMVYTNGASNVNTLRFSADNGSNYIYANNNIITLNTWQHVAFVYASGTGTFYVNAVSSGGSSRAVSIPTSGAALGYWYLSSDATRYFAGTMDEFRVSLVGRSADWLVTEVANQSSPPAVSAFTALTSISNSQINVF